MISADCSCRQRAQGDRPQNGPLGRHFVGSRARQIADRLVSKAVLPVRTSGREQRAPRTKNRTSASDRQQIGRGEGRTAAPPWAFWARRRCRIGAWRGPGPDLAATATVIDTWPAVQGRRICAEARLGDREGLFQLKRTSVAVSGVRPSRLVPPDREAFGPTRCNTIELGIGENSAVVPAQAGPVQIPPRRRRVVPVHRREAAAAAKARRPGS
jgi:hypothetical protein